MPKLMKKTPRFETEQAERAFREDSRNDSADYVDWSKAHRVVFPNLKPSTTAISLRLPDHLLDAIKAEANKRDVPYQSLMKMWLAEHLQASRRHKKAS